MSNKCSRPKPAATLSPKRRQSGTMKSFKSMKRRRRLLLVSTAASLLSTSSAQGGFPQDHKCPPGVNGWAPSADCTAYYWCSDGVLSSMAYDCVDGTLFDSVQLTCLPAEAVECEIRTTTTSTATQEYVWTELPTSSSPPAPSGDIAQMSGTLNPPAPTSPAPITPVPTATPTTGMPTIHPTPRQTFVGDAIYFADFPSRSCRTDNPPQWLTSDETFTTKRECCETVMNWIPVEDCLGEDWVEPNYFFVPSKNPTLNPTLSPSSSPSRGPTASPSFSPSSSPSRGPTQSPTLSPSESPTIVPTDSPNDAPTHFPSSSPTLSPTEFESVSPTYSPTTYMPTINPTLDPKIVMSAKLNSASKVEDSYLIELIGFANQGMDTYSTQAFSSDYNTYSFTTEDPTPSPIVTSSIDSQVSELILPAADDATISRQRPNVNFGEHQALAVDGGDPTTTRGDSNGEKFDSLIKFDISLVDPSRAVDSIILKLYAVEGCKSGGTFITTSSTSWDSSTITWGSAPVADGEYLARLPSIATSQWVDVDITKALSLQYAASAFVDPYISIRIESDENSRCLYSSMESGDAVSPRVIVRYMEQAVVQMREPHQAQATSDLPPPVIGDFLLLKATADATIVGNKPSDNFGGEPNLLMAFDTYTRDIIDSLIRFDLTELVSMPARTAVLSLYSETNCVSAGMITTTSGNVVWDEDTVTWASAPMYEPGTHDGTSLGVFGSVQANEWNAFNVLPAINAAVKAGKSAVTFRISSGNLNPCQFTSRNGGRAPKLMVAF